VQQPLANEQLLLRNLAEGNPKAAEQIYKQHYPVVINWIRSGNGDEADAADIFQEAMVVLYEKSHDPDFRLTCKIGTYLFAISKHLWYKKLEKSKKSPVAFVTDIENEDGGNDIADAQTDIQAHEEKELHFKLLDEALDQIGEPCRSLLKAFYHQDKSMQEIATDFGYTNQDNAKTQKYKCLTRLKKIFFNMQGQK
jgi:RNA polymerase sigma factor (sigma-70 family)